MFVYVTLQVSSRDNVKAYISYVPQKLCASALQDLSIDPSAPSRH